MDSISCHRSRANTMLEQVMASSKQNTARIIEEGWATLRETLLEAVEGEDNEVRQRRTFFCGALHLWTTISAMIGQENDGRVEKDNDRKLAMIHSELVEFVNKIATSEELAPMRSRGGH